MAKLGDYIVDIAAGPFGSNLKVECFVPIGFPIIDGANLKGFKVTDNLTKFVTEDKARSLNRSIAKRNDVVVTISGNVGQISYIPMNSKYKEYLVSQRQFRATFDTTKVYVPYLIYYFHTKEGQHKILSFANQTGVPALAQPLKNFKNIDINLPTLSKQREIAEVLSSLDDKIDVNRRINENLEQQAQALFKSWFVDFEPFKDGEFVESELGMIPKGWRIYSMNEIVEIVGGYSYKGSELQESSTAMATIKNFERKGGFKTDGFKEIIPSSKAKEEQYLNKFDILIAHTDLTQNADIIGNPALLLHFGKYEKLIMSMDLVKAKSKVDSITYGLLYSIFADCRFKSHALGYVNGTTVLHLSKKAIPEYKLALPYNLAILKTYGELLNSLFAREAEILEENDRLANLRDTLLPKLMSGELKVNEVEI